MWPLPTCRPHPWQLTASGACFHLVRRAILPLIAALMLIVLLLMREKLPKLTGGCAQAGTAAHARRIARAGRELQPDS